MKPIERLFEREGLPLLKLPADLATSYGGDLGIARRGICANFVASTDGVVGLGPDAGESGSVISGDSEPDHLVMALLRACADAVLIGAGTFRKAAGAFWRAADVYPSAAGQFAELRQLLGLRPHPLLVVVTASGDLDRAQPALRDSLIVTTPAGEARLRGTLPAGARLAVLDTDPIPGRALKDLLDAEKLHLVLTEGGPTLFGCLLDEGLVDELFLTISPRLFGRQLEDGRKPLVDGVDLAGRPLDLLSLRRHESHLFLRYATRGRSR